MENGIVYKAKLYEVPGSSMWGVDISIAEASFERLAKHLKKAILWAIITIKGYEYNFIS